MTCTCMYVHVTALAQSRKKKSATGNTKSTTDTMHIHMYVPTYLCLLLYFCFSSDIYCTYMYKAQLCFSFWVELYFFKRGFSR
jgi:hypothetical protein